MQNQIAKILSKSTLGDNDIGEVLKQIDKESANIVYQKCSDEFNFKSVQIDGSVFSTAFELAPVFGYANQGSLTDMLLNVGIDTVVITGLSEKTESLVRDKLNLSQHDFSTKLIDYKAFLTIALKGRGKNADKVREYLLNSEAKSRVDSIVYKNTGLDANNLADISKHADDPILQSVLQTRQMTQHIVDLRLAQLENSARIDKLESTVENEIKSNLPVTSQQVHLLNKKKDELVELMETNGQDKTKSYVWFHKTVKARFTIGTFTGLEREKFPLVIDWLDDLIAKEKAKLSQMELDLVG